MRDLPLLPAIRVFDAAARHGSFSAAADHLSISVIPTFATNFLAQRLGRFHIEKPEIPVRMEISEALVDFATGDIEVAVRGGYSAWDGLVRQLILPTVFTPMYAPSLDEAGSALSSPEDQSKLPILCQGDPWWQRWLSIFGLGDINETSPPARSLGPQIVEAGAAIAGHGVAMLTPAFFQNELDWGALIQPFEQVGDDGSGYWLVYPESRRNAPKIKKFRAWIDRETASFRIG